MSSQRKDKKGNQEAEKLRQELKDLKQVAANPPMAASTASETPLKVEGATSFDKLSGTEQAAGSLGVHPESWKPISFMNNKHYEQLIASNALDDNLARRIEVRAQNSASDPLTLPTLFLSLFPVSAQNSHASPSTLVHTGFSRHCHAVGVTRYAHAAS